MPDIKINGPQTTGGPFMVKKTISRPPDVTMRPSEVVKTEIPVVAPKETGTPNLQGVESQPKQTIWSVMKERREEKKRVNEEKKAKKKIEGQKAQIEAKYNRLTYVQKVVNTAKFLGIIASTASFTAGGVGMVAGIVASIVTVIALTIVLVGNGLSISSSYATWAIIVSVLLNLIFISWMFMKKEYRYYWNNVRKMFTLNNRGIPFVYALVLFKNNSCIFEVLKVDDGQVEYNKKVYQLKQKGLYRDLRGGWQIVVIEEDNSEIRTFFKDESSISADAWARFMLKVKDWAEIKANKNKQMLLLAVCAVGVIAAIGAYLIYQHNSQYVGAITKVCSDVCNNAVNQYVQATKGNIVALKP